MSKYIIAANWKMNPSTGKEAKKLFESVKNKAKGLKNVEVVICPPFVYLPLLKGLSLGAQNIFYKEKGAFTGEISPLMLKDLGVKYVIVGHSERRQYLNETNEVINKKIKQALVAGLKLIFCIGEQEGENKIEVLEKQISEGLKGVSASKVKNIVIAYEPVWAIGTGRNCSTEETTKSILFIRKVIAKLYSKELAQNIKILYGGSVDSKNSASYIKDAFSNGLLVGGASLNTEEFIDIVKKSAI